LTRRNLKQKRIIIKREEVETYEWKAKGLEWEEERAKKAAAECRCLF